MPAVTCTNAPSSAEPNPVTCPDSRNVPAGTTTIDCVALTPVLDVAVMLTSPP